MKKRDLYYERIPTKLLREDFRLLGTYLGRVIKDQEGLVFFKIVEKFLTARAPAGVTSTEVSCMKA